MLVAWLLSVISMTTLARAEARSERASGRPAAPDLFDTLYERGRPLEATLRTIHARFTETTTSSLLVQPLVAEGTLVVRRPHDVVLRYTKPDARILRLDASSLLFIWPDRHIRRRTDIRKSQARVQRYFVGKRPEELRQHFTISATEDTTQPGTWRIAMTPRRAQIKQGLAQLDLWVRQDTVMLSSMRMTFPGGDTKTMTFTDVAVNGPVSDADFDVR